MLGISLVEFLVIIFLGIAVIKPKDFPDIAHNLIKMIAKGKGIIAKVKTDLNAFSKEIGIEEIKNEVAVEMANEKSRLEKEIVTIIDIYGNEHQVGDVDEIRGDRVEDDIKKEIDKYNSINKKIIKNINKPR